MIRLLLFIIIFAFAFLFLYSIARTKQDEAVKVLPVKVAGVVLGSLTIIVGVVWLCS